MADYELPLEPVTFRKAMALFATGVAVLAVHGRDGLAVGMTANAISSVSLDPLLLLACVEKRANIASAMLEATSFSLCFLSDQQVALSDYFAGRWQADPPTFEFNDWIAGPLLVGCMAAIGCSRYDVIDGGDHWIILGEVVALYRQDNPPDPLIFLGSRYRTLVPESGRAG